MRLRFRPPAGQTLEAKLARARDSVASVLLWSPDENRTEGQDAAQFTYARAKDVRRVAKAALSAEGLLLIPTDVEDIANLDPRVVVQIGYRLVNADYPHECRWLTGIGESSWDQGGVSGAITNGRKSLVLDLLEIDTHDDRGTERSNAKRDARPITDSQLDSFIRPAQRAAGLDDTGLSRILVEQFDVADGDVRKLPITKAGELVAAIQASEQTRALP